MRLTLCVWLCARHRAGWLNDNFSLLLDKQMTQKRTKGKRCIYTSRNDCERLPGNRDERNGRTSAQKANEGINRVAPITNIMTIWNGVGRDNNSQCDAVTILKSRYYQLLLYYTIYARDASICKPSLL